MKSHWITRGMVGLASLGMALPTYAAGPNSRQPQTNTRGEAVPTNSRPAVTVQDIALGHGGTLSGQVVDAQGHALAATAVSIRQNGAELLQTNTDRDGKFAVSGLRGGMYQVVSGEGAGNFRLWVEDTAPPAAQPSALIVAQQDLVRGQTPLGDVAKSNVVIIGGITAAALSIPFIVHAARDKQSGS